MNAYYNEIESYPAQWLRNLVDAGHIASGFIDERDINNVQPADLTGYRQCHFFAGIGTWSHALRLAGWEDTREVWTGSCPCQPFSTAGKRGGTDDPRHLWPAWFRLIKECRPSVIFGEQVASKDGLAWLDLVYSDLESEGYSVAALDLCAAGAQAPHLRQRLYFVAHAKGSNGGLPVLSGQSRPEGIEPIGGGETGELGNTEQQRIQRGNGLGETGRFTQNGELGNATFNGERTQHGQSRQSREPQEQVGRPNISIKLGNPIRGGLAGWKGIGRDDRQEQQTIERTGGFWSDAEWLYCTDGYYRPTKPGIFPLASRYPARVAKLRAIGNAIVAPLAAEFIRAYMELDV